jgi:hypothetical protein
MVKFICQRQSSSDKTKANQKPSTENNMKPNLPEYTFCKTRGGNYAVMKNFINIQFVETLMEAQAICDSLNKKSK